MKRKTTMIRKKVSVILTFVLLFGIANRVVFAAASSDEFSPNSSYALSASLWTTLIDNGDMYVGGDGLIYVNDDNPLIYEYGYDDTLELIDTINYSIVNGILAIDSETMEVSNVFEIDKQLLQEEYESFMDRINGARRSMAPITITRNPAHGCSYDSFDLLSISQTNYNTIVDYYYDLAELAYYNPDIDPWSATIGFWLVKVNGDWNYKSEYPSWPLFCVYMDGNFQHVYPDYLGNFNYGYTGSFLFNLTELLFGSSAITGFNEKDQEDWPAIISGFQQAT